MLQRVLFMNQRGAESMQPTPASAIISITDPEANLASLNDGWSAVLRLAFDDVDPRIWEAEDGEVTPISESQALEIARFVELISATCRVLVVHCRYGQSRSAAIARAIGEANGLPVPDGAHAANPFVYELVKRSLHLHAQGKRTK